MPLSSFCPNTGLKITIFNTDIIDEKLKEMSRTYGEDAQKMINFYNQDPTRKSSIELLVVEKMVQDLILDKAKVTFKQKKFQEINFINSKNKKIIQKLNLLQIVQCQY